LKLMNLPNSITMSRIACVPLLLWVLSPHSPIPAAHGGQQIAASTLFILASITDGLDGYLARRRGQITTMGMLLDPLADKLLITSAYIALVLYDPRLVHVWIAVVVIGREFLVNGLRSIATAEGFTIEASDLGKLKTVIQIVSVVSAILDSHLPTHGLFADNPLHFGYLVIDFHFIAWLAIYWMAFVSIFSAGDYFIGFWRKIDHASEGRRKRSARFVLRRRKAAPAADETHAAP
jgi:CDP-diacylglycerol--glycerol-3-phosphate 3-phosphatidyltransferase